MRRSKLLLLCPLLFHCFSIADPILISEQSERNVPYIEFGDPRVNANFTQAPAGHNALGIHLEENHLSYTSGKKLMMRHAEAAGYAMKYSAFMVSEASVPVKVIDGDPFTGGTLPLSTSKDPKFIDRVIIDEILSSAAVLSMSMKTNSHHRLAIRTRDVEGHWEKWKDSDTVMTQSAGNNGRNCSRDPVDLNHQQEFSFSQLADTYAKVGSAQLDEDGFYRIKQASDCSGPDLILMNPYLKGLRYQFRPTEMEYRNSFARYKDNISSSKGGLEKFVLLLNKKRTRDLDVDGFMTNIAGTSFTSPSLAGYLLGIKQLCPSFTSFDLLAGAFAYATPIQSADNFPLNYQSNGVLPYDEIKGGFGFLDGSLLKEEMIRLCDDLKLFSKTHPKHFSKKISVLKSYTSGDKKVVEFNIADDFLVFRTIFSISSQSKGVPYKMRVVHPNGNSIQVRPANANWKTPSWGIATTNGFFGNSSKGTWKLEFDKTKDIDAINLKISGVAFGGIVSKIIENSKQLER